MLSQDLIHLFCRYGKALLGLSREESGVLGDGMPGGKADGNDDDDEDEGTFHF